MHKRRRILTEVLLCLSLVLCTVAAQQSSEGFTQYHRSAPPIGVVPLLANAPPNAVMHRTDPVERIALRLQRRLRHRGHPAPLEAVLEAVHTRQRLLRAHVSVRFVGSATTTTTLWQASPQRYPLWIHTDLSAGTIHVTLDLGEIRTTLEREEILDLPSPQVAILTATVTKGDLLKVLTQQPAKPGYRLDISGTAMGVASALQDEMTEITMPLDYVPGRIENATAMDFGRLTLLATGMSNFKGSPPGRIANVRKALREHVHNTLVPPGGTFSFNETLEGPVTNSRGWYDAKVIFNGNELRPAPGGGICQVSTTVFRAILSAGLPVTQRASHSLYVSYYEVGGVGIDATVFPDKQDLAFVNDTGNYLLIQSYEEGSDAYVHIYGTPDGRSVTIEGPYFRENAPEGFTQNGRKLHSNEIAWIQHVSNADGTTQKYPVVSRYQTLPRYIVNKYTALSAN
jgi:vancomycin resistance protein YoaR